MSSRPESHSADSPSHQELVSQLRAARQRIHELERYALDKTRELQAVERTLSQANEYLSDVLQAVSDALFVVDDAGVVLTVNRAALSLLGYEDHELLGEELRLLAPAIELETLGAGEGRERPAHDGPVRVNTALQTRTGESIPVLLSISRLQDAQGDVVHVCAATDMRERLKLESELHHAQRLESLGQLSAGVAHEINNPLSYLIGNLQYLSEELSDNVLAHHPDAREALEQASEGAERVREVVADLLAFARQEKDDLKAVDMRRVLESTIRLVGGQVKRRAQLRSEITMVPMVRAQPARLGQVFLNLIMNAVQALPRERRRDNWVLIRTEARTDEVVVEVRDNGPGIPDEVRTRIFEPFFTTKPVGVGTGLGLSICHGIIKRFGGRITLTTELGQGTSFFVHLPISPASDK